MSTAKGTRKTGPDRSAGSGRRVRVATWNINSVRIRLEPLGRFVRDWKPDILCLQETKVVDQDFPLDAVRSLGFAHHAIRGQKSYNGVAVFSRLPLANPGFEDWCEKGDCRHLSVELPGGVELHNFYVPAGGDIPDPDANPKFDHKLRFVDQMRDWFADRRDSRPRILLGDLNIAPLETDVWSHKQLLRVVSHTPVEVEKLGRVMEAHGWVDAVREVIPPEEKLYSWWSYRSPEWDTADKGRRLDHVWVTPDLKGAIRGAEVARAVRGFDMASDHAPVLVDLELPA